MREGLRFIWALCLIAVLTVLAAVLGCEPNNKDDDNKVLYGPAPVDASVDGGSDAGQPDACEPMALYGPQPCSTNPDDCVTRYGAGWVCDTQYTFSNGCGGSSTWPLCKQDVDAGTPDGGATDGCEPMVLYGPPPCDGDEDCTAAYGAGWYCDTQTSIFNGCGQSAGWPMCKQSVDAGVPDGGAADACEPMVLYGPQVAAPCQSDEECKRVDPNTVCDKTNTRPDECGRPIAWPVCK